MRKLFHLHVTQKFPATLDVVWEFISRPENLSIITPPEMRMEIINKHLVSDMYEGMIIYYRIRPLWGIYMTWVTVIPHYAPKNFFVDEQKYGPYKLWHHQHFLYPIEGGVEMSDVIHYQMPYGFLGNLLHRLVVRKKLKRIFDYRRNKMQELFGKFPE